VKRGGFLKRKIPLRPKTRIRVVGHSERTEVLQNIQDLLRALAISRDKGCVLRDYPEAGACGGYTKAGELILQAPHHAQQLGIIRRHAEHRVPLSAPPWALQAAALTALLGTDTPTHRAGAHGLAQPCGARQAALAFG
jgi:hypothetical protein